MNLNFTTMKRKLILSEKTMLQMESMNKIIGGGFDEEFEDDRMKQNECQCAALDTPCSVKRPGDGR